MKCLRSTSPAPKMDRFPTKPGFLLEQGSMFKCMNGSQLEISILSANGYTSTLCRMHSGCQRSPDARCSCRWLTVVGYCFLVVILGRPRIGVPSQAMLVPGSLHNIGNGSQVLISETIMPPLATRDAPISLTCPLSQSSGGRVSLS